LEDIDRCALSSDLESNQLGEATFLGDRVWDQQSRFTVTLGALSHARFRDFLPDRDALHELIELTKFIVGPALAFDVQLKLRAEEVPFCRLSDAGEDAPRLGWTGWLKTKEFIYDASDAVFAEAA
jgi:type VI secretion system protein ImpH